MQQRYQQHQDVQANRQRDQYGRFESEQDDSSRNRDYDNSRDEGYRNARGHQTHVEPRDENGRFESVSSRRSYDQQSSGQYERPRDENGRFESEGRSPGSYGQMSWGQSDRPRDEHGRFESGERGQVSRYQSANSGAGMDSREGNSQRGQHSGKGPKGYRRPDERIQEDVNEALTQHPHLDASEIEVKVHNGVVSLTGTVSDRQYKRMAEDVVERCSGVQDVRNEIRTARDSDTVSEKSKSNATAAGKSS